MTLIVSPRIYTSKAALKAALDAGDVLIHEPSVMGEWIKPARELPVGFQGVVTNHPKRNRFATIKRRPEGWHVS